MYYHVRLGLTALCCLYIVGLHQEIVRKTFAVHENCERFVPQISRTVWYLSYQELIGNNKVSPGIASYDL